MPCMLCSHIYFSFSHVIAMNRSEIDFNPLKLNVCESLCLCLVYANANEGVKRVIASTYLLL